MAKKKFIKSEAAEKLLASEKKPKGRTEKEKRLAMYGTDGEK